MLSPSTNTGNSGSGSPTQVQPSINKRKRKALSCYDCRRRKLRCDRELPSCARCVKAGHGDTCSYDERSLTAKHSNFGAIQLKHSSSTSQTSPGWSPSLSLAHQRLTDGSDHRRSTVQATQTSGTWQQRGQVGPITKDSEQRPAIRADAEEILEYPRPATPTETIIFRGENFKTQYYGGSNPTSLIAHVSCSAVLCFPLLSWYGQWSPYHIPFRLPPCISAFSSASVPAHLTKSTDESQFPELRSYMREAIKHHTSLPRVQRDLKSFQLRWKAEKTNVALRLTDEELLQFVPSREIVDDHIRLYFDTSENLYRILHQPNFWKEYHLFWEDRQAASPSFVVILLLIMATVSVISTREESKFIGDSAMARERAVLWIEVSETWHRQHSQKNIYLAIWQIRCLLMLAKQINIVKKKKTWTEAGTLVREAMSAGFHRDPTLLGEKVSVFDQEMRRRLWATMTELELQVSIDRGMPSATAGVPSDSASVLNINDDQLGVERGSPPMSKPSDECTACSYLHISRASFQLRVMLNSLVNDLSSPSRYEEVLNYEEQVTKEIQKLPTRKDRRLSNLTRALLDVQLRQFLILLHAPFARQADTNSRYSLSRMICLNAAASIIEQYSQLQGSEKFLLLCLRHDYFRAALHICHTMYISISIRSKSALAFSMVPPTILTCSTDDLFLDSQSNTFIQYMENALFMLEDRITRLGTGYTHYWYISAACSLLRSAMRPEDSSAQKQQAIDRVARQYFRIFASQEDFLKAKEIVFPAGISKVR